jgi:energy-coupling factor transporter ATP-binding protein EcfA2
MIRITGLSCRNVGALADLKLELSDGLNIVLGRNEAGKSTLLRAIRAVLFGVMDSSLKPIGYDGDYGAALRLETEDGSFLFDREFSNNRIRVYRIGDKEPEPLFDAKVSPRGRGEDFRAYHKRLESIFGLSDPDLFAASALLEKQDLALGGTETIRKIRAILAGQTTHDHDAVLEGLRGRYFEITSVNPNGRNKSKPRLLQTLQAEKAELEARRRDAQERFERCLSLKESASQAKTRESRLKAESRKVERLVKVGVDYFGQEDQKQRCEEKHLKFVSERGQVTTLLLQVEQLDRELAELGLAGKIDDEAARVMNTHISLSRGIADKEKSVEQTARLLTETKSSASQASLFGALAAGTLGILGAALALWKGWWGLPAIVAAFAASSWIIKKHRDSSEKIAARAKASAEAEAALFELRASIEKLDLAEGVEGLKADQFPRLLAEREKANGIQIEKEKIAAKLSVLPSMADVDEALSRYEREIAVISERQDSIRRMHPELESIDQDQLIEMTGRLSGFEDEIEASQQEAREASEKYAGIAALTENPEVLGERIDELDERIEELEFRLEAIGEAITAVVEAAEIYRGEFLTHFAENVDRLFSEILDKDDRSVKIDADLVPGLSFESGVLPLEALSTGTRDQLYLACRIVLSERLAKGRAIPLLLDDPLSNFDSERAARTIDLFSNIAQKHQVVIFSHEERLVEMIEDRGNLVSL